MCGLHGFLLRYGWYRTLVKNDFIVSLSNLLFALCFLVLLFFVSESVIKSVILMLIALIIMCLNFLRYKMANSDRKCCKNLYCADFALWAIIFFMYLVKIFW